jgi:hypothetical protein
VISHTVPYGRLLLRHDQEAFFPLQSTARVETISLPFESCCNKDWRNRLALKTTARRNVAGHLPSDYMEGVPGNQDIALLCSESLKRKQVITRLEQA